MSPLTRKESLNTWKIKRRNKRRGCGKVKERSAHVLKYCYYYDSRDILRENVIFIWKKILEIVGILLLYSSDIFNFKTLRKYFYNSLKKKKEKFHKSYILPYTLSFDENTLFSSVFDRILNNKIPTNPDTKFSFPQKYDYY